MTIAKLACATVLALVLLQAPATGQYRKILGGVNLDQFCKTIHGSNSGAMMVGDAWRCKMRRLRNGVAISVEDACRWQYGRNDAKAVYRTSDKSWVCVAPFRGGRHNQ